MPLSPLHGAEAGRADLRGGLATDRPAAIAYAAAPHVRDIIASLGRTEDIRFSPSGRRLAIAAAVRGKIVIIDLDISASAGGTQVALTHGMEVSSPCLRYPHGMDFVDDETLLVASRKGNVAIFKLPSADMRAPSGELSPIQVLRHGEVSAVREPGSIAVLACDPDRCHVLVCDNAGHNLTRHVLDRDASYAVVSSEVLVEKWLDVPDGLCVSRDGRWIAVSNHNTHGVMLYENSPSLNRAADPDGILRGVRYPHGLRFDADGRHLFVADAGAPYLHVYAKGAGDWRGVRNPVASIRIMDAETFARGRHNAREGGPKGVDMDRGMNVLAVTSEWQPLAFFSLPAMLETAHAGGHLPELDGAVACDGDGRLDPQAVEIRYELDTLAQISEVQGRLRRARAGLKDAERQARSAAKRERKAKDRLAAIKKSASWRLTAPLRWLHAAWPRRR